MEGSRNFVAAVSRALLHRRARSSLAARRHAQAVLEWCGSWALLALCSLLGACFGDGVSLHPQAHGGGASHDTGDGDAQGQGQDPLAAGPDGSLAGAQDAAVEPPPPAMHDAGGREQPSEPDASPLDDAGGPELVDLTVSVSGVGSVHSADDAFTCASEASPCTWRVVVGKVVSILASPKATSRFSGWGEACAGAHDTQCSLVMRGPASVSASFVASTAALHAEVQGPGEISGGPITCSPEAHACDATVRSGEQVTLTAHPINNSQFTGWTGDCAASEQDTSCTLTLDAAKSVGAHFVPRFTLSVLLENGPECAAASASVYGGGVHCEIAGSEITTTSECTASFLTGNRVTLTFTPGGYTRLAGWAGACSGKSATCEVEMDRDQSVVATVCGLIP